MTHITAVRSKVIWYVLSVIMACMLSGNVQAKEGKDPVRIGVILPLSGEMASNGAVVYDAYQVAADLSNESGGVNGRPVELIKGDSPDPSAAQQNARRMAGDGVKVFIGSLANHLGLAASAAAERYGSVYFETTAVSEEFTNRGLKHVFRASTPGAKMGTTAIEFGKQYLEKSGDSESGKVKVAIVFEPNWQLIAEAARDKAKEYGWDVVVYTNYDSKSLDFSPLVAQLKEANPDIVLAGGWLNDSVLLNRQSKQVGFRPRAWIGLSGGHSIDDYAKNLGDLAEGVFVVNASSTVADSGLTASGQELKSRFLARWDKVHPGQVPNGLVYEAFSNAWVLMHDALPKAKSMGNDDIRKAILSVDLERGSLPNGTGAKFTDDGANTRSFYSVLQWQDKKLVTIWPDKLATSKAIAWNSAQ